MSLISQGSSIRSPTPHTVLVLSPYPTPIPARMRRERDGTGGTDQNLKSALSKINHQDIEGGAVTWHTRTRTLAQTWTVIVA